MSLYYLHRKKNSFSGWTHKKLIEENYELQMKLSGAGRNHETPTAVGILPRPKTTMVDGC